jgi:hypothetical protein
MKNRTFPLLLQGLAVGVAAFLAQDARSQSTLYDNATTTQMGNFNYGNAEYGNEVVLAGGPNDNITTFEVQLDLLNSSDGTAGTPAGGENVTVNFYNMTGGASSTPASVFYSFSSSLASLGLSSFTQGSTLTLNPNVIVPQDFTWTVTFSGIPGTETAGLGIFNGTPNGSGTPIPNVGNNYNDAWLNTGGTWSTHQTSPNVNSPGLQFGALIQGTPTNVPEPSTIALGVIGACAFLARRRKS